MSCVSDTCDKDAQDSVMINCDAGATESVVGDAAADIGVAYSSWL